MSFANIVREAHEADTAREATALEKELRANGVPEPKNLGALRRLKLRYRLPDSQFEQVLTAARSRKK